MSTVLLFDAGNTNTKIGLADKGGLNATYTLPTRPANTADDWGLKIEAALRREGVAPSAIKACVVSSVVPPLDPLITKMARRFLDCDALFVPADLPLPLENGYARPEQVGADVLTGCFGARARYADPSLVVVDFGTATTLACMEGDTFLGGLICPGVLSSASALAGGTAKLPKVDLKLPYEELTWGRSTAECLNQGLVWGFGAMIDGLVAKLGAQMSGKPLVVATGGLADSIARVSPAIDHVVPDLVMEGLHRAYFR